MISALLVFFACGGEAPPSPAPSAPPVAVAAPAPAPAPAPPPAAAASGEVDLADGERVYTTFCTSCHQADGTGMNGMLAANFKADKARLAKSDAELLKSIAEGVTGPVGTMPPWGGSTTEAERQNVLAYIRKTFGE